MTDVALAPGSSVVVTGQLLTGVVNADQSRFTVTDGRAVPVTHRPVLVYSGPNHTNPNPVAGIGLVKTLWLWVQDTAIGTVVWTVDGVVVAGSTRDLGGTNGDGTAKGYNTLGLPNGSHEFGAVVTYTDGTGAATVRSTNIITNAGAPVPPPVPVTPVVTIVGAKNGLTLSLTDHSTNVPTSWAWDFGDGSTSTSQNPVHAYAAPGTYVVTLRATNAGGTGIGSGTFSVTNVVTPPIGGPFPGFQKAINAASAGAIIDDIPPGTYTEGWTIPAGKPLTLRGRSAGVILTGGSNSWQVRADDVTLEWLEFRAGLSSYQHGALNVEGVSRFTGRHLIARDTPAGPGLAILGGRDHLLEDVEAFNNFNCGMVIHGGMSAGPIDGFTARRLNLHDNNPQKDRIGWESGGIKLTVISHVLIEDSIVAGNQGNGIWFDINCHSTEIRRNTVHDNSREGIMFEISDGVSIHDNVCWRNGYAFVSWGYGANIFVSSSKNADVFGNTVAWAGRGISVISQVRGSTWDVVSGVNVHDNVVVQQTGERLFGFSDDHNGPTFAPNSGNVGSGNRFWCGAPEPSAGRFQWAGDRNTLAAFAGTPAGQLSSYLTDSEKVAILTTAGIPLTA